MTAITTRKKSKKKEKKRELYNRIYPQDCEGNQKMDTKYSAQCL